MKNIKNISAVGVTATPFLFLAQHAFAQTDFCPHGGTNGGVFNKLCALDAGAAVGSVVSFLFVIAILVALGFLIFGGFKWITSGGDKANVEAARGTILAAIIGLVIIFLSYVILNLVLQFFFGFNLNSIRIPTLGA